MSLQSFIYCKDCQQSEEYSITVKTGNKLSDDFNEIYFIENSEQYLTIQKINDYLLFLKVVYFMERFIKHTIF